MNKKTWAAAAIAGIAAASLAGCANGGGAGDSPSATAEALLTALADGNVQQVQTLAGLDADDQMLTLLPQATERIGEIEVLTSDPENLDELTEVDAEVAYTLGGERFEDIVRVSKTGEEGAETWVATAPTASVQTKARSAFSVGDAQPASSWTLLPGTYPISGSDDSFVQLEAESVVAVADGSGVADPIPVVLNEEAFLPAAQVAVEEALATCLTDFDPNRATPECKGSYADIHRNGSRTAVTLQGEVPKLSVALDSAGGDQLPTVNLLADGPVTMVESGASNLTRTADFDVTVVLNADGNGFAAIKITD